MTDEERDARARERLGWERHAEKDRAYQAALNERDAALAQVKRLREALLPFAEKVAGRVVRGTIPDAPDEIVLCIETQDELLEFSRIPRAAFLAAALALAATEPKP